MPRLQPGHNGPHIPGRGNQRSPLLVLYLALFILGRRGIRILRRDIKGLSRLTRHLQGQVALRFWLLGPYYGLAKRYFSTQTQFNKPTMASSKRNVQKVIDNYKTYSGIFAILGSASGASGSKSSYWPFGSSTNSGTSRANGSNKQGDENSSGSLSPVPGLQLQCPTCVQRELEDVMEREFASMGEDEVVPLIHVEKASSEAVGGLEPIAGGKARLGDIVSSTDRKAPISAGFIQLERGSSLDYEYFHHAMNYVISGSFDISDGTGKQVHAAPGDVLYFPKGTKVIFSSVDGGSAFYTAQRGDDLMDTPFGPISSH